GDISPAAFEGLRARLQEPAELALLGEIEGRRAAIDRGLAQGRYPDVLAELAGLRPAVDRFFVEVLVMTDEASLRDARLTLLRALRDLVLHIADLSEIVPHTES